ncbi:MAG: rRNA maturation RNase YbeY [Candidatus Nanopelagicus sp.]
MKIQTVNNSTFICDEAVIASVAKYSLVKMGIHPDSELGIRIVDENEMTNLHMKWMNLPGPTDVLSFPMDEVKPNSSATGPAIIGDIVLCPAFAQKNSKQLIGPELELLTVHGVLHLLGFDHEDIADEAKMFALQDEILKEWRLLV